MVGTLVAVGVSVGVLVGTFVGVGVSVGVLVGVGVDGHDGKLSDFAGLKSCSTRMLFTPLRIWLMSSGP
jgi:hypothetical protein